MELAHGGPPSFQLSVLYYSSSKLVYCYLNLVAVVAVIVRRGLGGMVIVS
jgi:hypothetical protein